MATVVFPARDGVLANLMEWLSLAVEKTIAPADACNRRLQKERIRDFYTNLYKSL
jgi:hypothetical protein